MYIHGHFYNEQDERIAVHIVTHGDRSEELEIHPDGDGGALYFTADPVELTSEVNDTFDVLLPVQATIRLLTKSYVPDFFCSSCRDAVVNIYRGEECLFAGYVEPQTYSQGYNEEYDEIELSCIDALTALQYGKYRGVGSVGVTYSLVKSQATQRTFLELFEEIMSDITSELDIVGGHSMHYWYDGSKSVDSSEEKAWSVLSDVMVSELLFLGDEEDDVWQADEVLSEMLKYLNLHIVQEAFDFYLFSWESVRTLGTRTWTDVASGETQELTIAEETIETRKVVGCETSISVGEVYNQLLLTCAVESIESVIESPLDSDLLVSPYSNKQKYLTEYSSDGEGESAIKAFDALIQGNSTSYEQSAETDWYVQVMNNPLWSFPDHAEDDGKDLVSRYCSSGTRQESLLNALRSQIGACLLSVGKVEKVASASDNSLTSKVSMTDYLVVSVNGNGEDGEEAAWPSVDALKASIPVAVYNGNMSGGVFSPSDSETVNYIVLSGKVVLNPVMAVTDSYSALKNYSPTTALAKAYEDLGWSGIKMWWHQTVASRKNSAGRYYAQCWWASETPLSGLARDAERTEGWVPYTGTGPEEYEFKYSAIGDGSDQVSKVAVLACMLIIGDKCVVETGTHGQVSDFEWRDYKPLDACADEDEYYQQCFTIGFDPAIGDKLIGTSFSFQNNISYELGIDAEGIAIPIKQSDGVSGAVKFMILGPVNTLWDDVSRRHPTFFRHTKWGSTSVPLLSHVSSIVLEEFDMKVYSNNGLVNNAGESDIVYMSDTKETFVNKKDDLEFRISSALTSAECRELGVTNSVKMSTPMLVDGKTGVLSIYDRNQGEWAKPEQLYVDSYWQEYHEPRVEMKQKFRDVSGGVVSRWRLYVHPSIGKRFFVEGISRNLEDGSAEVTMKEVF